MIVPEAMGHPAKFSSRLIARIYDHILSEGWFERGDRIIDPFGGVALGALDALRNGLNWTGIELEDRFVDLGNKNIDLWNKTGKSSPRWGSARLLQGDSRQIVSLLEKNYAGAVSSPPYADGAKHTGGADPRPDYGQGEKTYVNYGSTDGQLGAMKADHFEASISSPPFLQSEGGSGEASVGKGNGRISHELLERHKAGNKSTNAYGESGGQLSNMPARGFDAALSSPPFGAAVDGGGVAKKGYQNEAKRKGSEEKPFDLVGKRAYMPENQGEAEGQLANMPARGFDAAVSSPPYEESPGHGGRVKEIDLKMGIGGDLGKYGTTLGQIADSYDFWLAARLIVDQVYQVLAPGAHAVWVVKNYVKAKKIVPFCDQWRQLCEAAGFETLHEHRAMLVHGVQQKLDGGEHRHESKSFFRRLAEKNGSPRVDYEVVYCMRKIQ